jgi:hypothetical protein
LLGGCNGNESPDREGKGLLYLEGYYRQNGSSFEIVELHTMSLLDVMPKSYLQALQAA